MASHFIQWCGDNHLDLNVSKTKAIIIGPPSPQHPIVIDKQTVEMVDSFKYLIVTLDNRLDQHINDIKKRGHQKVSVIRKLTELYVAPHLVLLLYHFSAQSTVLFTCFFNMLSVTNWAKLTRKAHTDRIIGLPTPNLTEINNKPSSRRKDTN